MVDPFEIKLIVSKGQSAIRIEKRWVARDSPVQQIDSLPKIQYLAPSLQKNIIGARIQIKSNEIPGRFTLNGQFLSRCNFGMQLLGDFLRDLALDCEHVVQIAVILFDPHMGISPRIDQLRIQMKMCAGPADAALQNVRYPQLVTDLAHISFAAVLHDTRPADDFQVSDLRQLGQNVVLHAVGKSRVLFLLAEVFKRKDGDPGCYRLPDQFAFRNDPAARRCKSNQRRHQQRTRWISSHPFPSAGENSGAAGLNGFVLKPTFEVFSQRESGRVAALWIFLETLEANS